jgi:tRNA(fMet)-specific endonuclease VapC
MPLYLIDTNILSALSKPTPARALERKVTKHLGEMVIAATVLHEMWFGIERLPRSRRRAELEKFMGQFVAPLRVLPYGERAARWHASERARLAAVGRVVDFADGQIGAVAAVQDAIVVTANVGHFEVFEGLSVENWLA